LVIGHEEYRRVTHQFPYFRRAFAEVYRNRSFWFLGAGLADPFILELFGEILEMYGPNPQMHYALVPRGEVNPDFVRDRFNTVVIELDSYEDLPRWLSQFKDAIRSPRTKVMRWDYAVHCPDHLDEADRCTELQIIRGRLPRPRGGEECVAISAGGKLEAPLLNPGMADFVAGIGTPELGPFQESQKYVRRIDDSQVYLVVARDQEGFDRRDARIITESVRELMDRATRDGFSLVRCQLIAAGPGREFPALVSFIQMVRGFAMWWRDAICHDRARPKLAIHLVAPDVLFAVSSGRINIIELLTAEDLRLWVEVVRTTAGDGPYQEQQAMRHLLEIPGTTPVLSVMYMFDIPEAGWEVNVYSPPRRAWAPLGVESIVKGSPQSITLDSIGVFPGSTLQFRRV
jgi:hypothetical protein